MTSCVRRGYLGLLLVASLASVPGATLPVLAADTPSLGGGDCWRTGTPLTCVWNHDGVKGWVYFSGDR